MSKFNQIEYIREYNKQKYKTVKLYAPPDWYAEMKQHAAARGESVNAFISRAAAAQIERDRAEDERRAAEAVATLSAPGNPEAVTPSEAPAPTPTPETVTPSEPETAGAKQSRPTSDGKQTAAEAPEDSTPRTDNAPADISKPEQDGRTTATPKPRRGRPPKQAENDPAQLTLDDSATDSNSGRG